MSTATATDCEHCGHHAAYHRHPSGCLDCECTWWNRADYPEWVAPAEETVKRAALWGGCVETYRTETEINGWRATQGLLMDVPKPPPPPPTNQGTLF